MKGLSPAVVLNLHYTGLGIARALGQAGIPVIGLSHDTSAPGRHSRFLEFRRSPDSELEAEPLSEFLLDMAREFDHHAVLFPTRDKDLMFMDRFRDVLTPNYRLILPDTGVFEVILDKWLLASEAQRAGVAIPKTFLASTHEEVERTSKSMPYPLVIKPRRAADWRTPAVWDLVGRRKAVRVNTADELLAFHSLIREVKPEVLLQEWVQGEENEFLIFGCYRNTATSGTVGVTFRKWLQYPPEIGTGCLVECIDAPFVAIEGERILSTLGYTGIAEVEFKRDCRTGELKLIEINPRPWDQHSLSTACGVNLCMVAYRDALGEPYPRTHGDRKGWWIAGEGLISRCVEEMRAGNSLNWGLLRRVSLEPKVFSLFDASDPMPALSGTWNLIKAVAGSVSHKLKGKRAG